MLQFTPLFTTAFPSPVTAGAKADKGDTEDEEDDEGDDAHLWGWKTVQHANHPDWSHCPGALRRVEIPYQVSTKQAHIIRKGYVKFVQWVLSFGNILVMSSNKTAAHILKLSTFHIIILSKRNHNDEQYSKKDKWNTGFITYAVSCLTLP